jgi:hypothetical protein
MFFAGGIADVLLAVDDAQFAARGLFPSTPRRRCAAASASIASRSHSFLK